MSGKNFSIGLLLGAAMQSSFSSAMRSAKGGADDLAKHIKKTNKELGAVQDAKKYRDILVELRKKQEVAGSGSERLAAGIAAVEKHYREAKREAKSYGYEINKLDAAEKKLLKQQRSLEREKKSRNGGGIVATGAGALGGVVVGAAAIAAEIGTAAYEFGEKYAKQAQEIGETAKTLGYNVEAFQELEMAAKAAGISNEQFAASSVNMTRSISEAAIGQGKAKGVLKELGFDAAKLAKMKPEDQMDALSKSLAGVRLEGDRVRIASKIFGKEGGADMLRILQEGPEALAKFRAEARATGGVMSEDMVRDGLKLNDALDAAEQSFMGLSNTVGAALAPALAEVAGELTEFTKTHGPEIHNFGKLLGFAFSLIAKDIELVGGAIQTVGESIGNTLGWIETKTGWISKVGDLFQADQRAEPGGAKPAAAQQGLGLAAKPSNVVPMGRLMRDGGATVNNHNTTANIVVHAAPGQDEQKIGEAVRTELDKRDREQARQQRGAFHDGALTAG